MTVKRGRTWYVNIRRRYRGKMMSVRRAIGPKKKDAEEAETAIKAAMASGTFEPEEKQETIILRRPTFREFVVDEYLPWSELHHSPAHHSTQTRTLARHITPVFGDVIMDQITNQSIENYCRKRHGAKYKIGNQTKRLTGASVNRELMAIRAVFRQAVKWSLQETNPAKGVESFREAPEVKRLLSGDEIARFVEAMPDRLRALVAVVVYAGLRRTEVFQLRWKDVDWEHMELRVMNRLKDRTKGNKHRQIPISNTLERYLRQHPRHLHSDYVFVSSQGNQYTKIDRALDTAARAIGIPEGQVRLHQLRHAFCSHAQMQGIPPRTVQLWMGHKSLATTLKYSHVSPDHERAAIQRLNYTADPETKTKGESRSS